MANYRVDIVDIELNSGSVHRSFLNYTIGGGDYLANQFGFNALRNSQAENISGRSKDNLRTEHRNSLNGARNGLVTSRTPHGAKKEH